MNFDAIKISRPKQIRPCKICGTPSPLFGSVDFSKSCLESNGFVLPRSEIMVGYNRCPRCNFLFTPAFDRWGYKEFEQGIYNDDYILFDPEYKEIRPTFHANWLTKIFGADKESLSLLDYGGGNGLLAHTLLNNGFRYTATYDPFNPEFAELPDRKFNLVSCFETFEHVPDPRHLAVTIANCVDDNGIVVFSTLTQPDDFDQIGLNWWYVGPRNGHISLFSWKALAMLWEQQGFSFGSFNNNLHIAYRKLPGFAKHLFPAK